MTGSPGPSTDEGALQEDFLGALQALGDRRATTGSGVAFLWSVADIWRGDYKQSDYGKLILPFTELRRHDCVLKPSKEAMLTEKELGESQGLDPEPFLLRVAGQGFCNTSALGMKRLMGDQDNIGENLRISIQTFTPALRDLFESGWGALHATGGAQADGESDCHRRRSGPHPERHRPQPLRPHRGHRRHARSASRKSSWWG
jgi:hypothetical protein